MTRLSLWYIYLCSKLLALILAGTAETGLPLRIASVLLNHFVPVSRMRVAFLFTIEHLLTLRIANSYIPLRRHEHTFYLASLRFALLGTAILPRQASGQAE